MTSISLNGTWGFLIDPYNRGLNWGQYHQPFPERAGDLHRGHADLLLEQVTVPGSWQQVRPEYAWYGGAAFFFKTFPAPAVTPGQRVFLRFGAVSFRARAWLNGREIGSMDHPYLPWEMEITDDLRADNSLVVRVEGAPRADDTFPIPGWRCFPGLLRAVELHITGRERVAQIFVDPELRLDRGQGRLRVRIERDSPTLPETRARWQIGDCQGEVVLPAGVPRKTWRTPWQPVAFWRPGSPALYSFALELGGDRYERAVGFREFRVQGDRFTLNGEPIWLRGVSRHELHPTFGMTANAAWIKQDFDLIAELGCNAVRLAHYPHDEAVLDECDRRGLLAWVEIPVYWEADFTNRAVCQRMLSQTEALVRRDYHHPSVVIWSVANEVRSDRPAALRALEAARQRVRRYDPVRPVTFASHPLNPDKNLALAIVDFCAANIYRGWYEANLSRLADDLDALRQATRKPVILSEFGAGANAGQHGGPADRWTEEYQAEVVRRNLRIARSHAAGCFVWLLHDFNDPSRVHSRITRGFLNNKGLVTEDRRRRKLAFQTVREIFRAWREQDRENPLTHENPSSGGSRLRGPGPERPPAQRGGQPPH